METEKNFKVTGFKEKPTLSYLSNAGIYLMKCKCIDLVPKGECFNATDLIDKLIEQGMNVLAYPFSGYWLDIGKHEDYKKAQVDIKAIKF
jgi:NDP-sugar pyrophosphorylase family protein